MGIRYLFSLILFITSFNAWSSFDEAKFARSLGLQEVLEGHPYNFLGVHTMYADESLTRQMLVMRDIPAPLESMRIIPSKNYLIVEIPKSEKSYTSMALVGISEEEIKGYWKTTSLWENIRNEFIPLKKAYSFDCEIVGLPKLNGLEAVQRFFGTPFARNALSCMGEFLDGAWEATGGFVVSVGKGIVNLIKDPKKFWDEKVGQMRNLANFIRTFDLKMKNDFPALANLPADLKAHIVCGMAGGLGASLLSSVMMGSAPLMTTLSMMSTFLMRVVKLVPVFDTLRRTGVIGQMPKGFFTKLVKGKNHDNVLARLNQMAAQRRPDLILATMRAY